MPGCGICLFGVFLLAIDIEPMVKYLEREADLLRVIAGEAKGRKLNSPEDRKIRPTTDRVKESLFNLITGDIDENTVVFDLFSGSGGLGIEALSRGAKRAYFCDKNRISLSLTKSNIKLCRMEERSILFFGDYKKGLDSFPEKADIIFLDPPYDLSLWVSCMKSILEADKLKIGGIAVIERGTDDLLEGVPEEFELEKERRYGASTIAIYRRIEIE